MQLKITFSFLLLLFSISSHAQNIPGIVQNEDGDPFEKAHVYIKESGETTITTSGTMVITATRTQHSIEEVNIPATAVSNKEINQTGNMPLSNILSEQSGLSILNDHGTGIQVQDFIPGYMLIMIDGKLVIE
ncbi:MAG: hypothetical protein FH748_01310 [Balneolaceae bacterium]|nr:hypothetical protein [Balneolaceae bacterium]